jgi:hypothetical protein
VLEFADEILVVMISNDVSLPYVMTYYQYEFFANIVDRNNRNKQNFDRINHQQIFYIQNKIDIVNVVQFEDVSENEVFEHQLKKKRDLYRVMQRIINNKNAEF